jgi:hypothetical protein
VSSTVLLIVFPFLVLVLVYGSVVIFAVRHARPEDVPVVLSHANCVFRVLGSRLARPDNAVTAVHPAAPQEETVQDLQGGQL